MMDYTPGQTVWLTPGGNFARMYKFSELPVPTEIVSVKRKYFYVKYKGSQGEIKFDKETGRSVCEDCNSSWTLWDSPQAYKDRKESLNKLQAVRNALRNYRSDNALSLEDVRTIYAILDAAGLIRKDNICGTFDKH